MLYVFPHYVIAKWVKYLHHKDTNYIPNLQHKMRKFNVFNKNLPPFHNVSKSIINASKTISNITLPLITNPKFENLKEKTYFHKPAFDEKSF